MNIFQKIAAAHIPGTKAKVITNPVAEIHPPQTPTRVTPILTPPPEPPKPTAAVSAPAAAIPVSETIHAAPVAQPIKESTVDTSTVVPVPKQNGFISFFKKLGQDLAKIIPVADTLEDAPAVQAAETVAFGPALTAVIKEWLDRAETVEAATVSAVGAASASTDASNLQKAAIVINGMIPTAQGLATQLGASPLTTADMQVFNNAILTIAGLYKVPAATSVSK